MGRLTKWGCDRRGRQVVPAVLGRGFIQRASAQRYRLAHHNFAPAMAPEPIEDLELLASATIMPAPSGRMASDVFPAMLEDAPPPIDDDGEPDPDLEDDGEPLSEQLRAVRVPRDLSRFIAASRAKAAPPAPAPRALEPALSPEECRRCGIPGRKGCAHQAPYAVVDLATLRRLSC